MTEAEWFVSPDPRPLLIFLEEKSSPRKARLYACAVGRSLWPYLGDERCCRVVEVAERYADDLAYGNELQEALSAAQDIVQGWAGRVATCAGDRGAWQGARLAMVCLQRAQAEREGRELAKVVASRSRKILSCIFGNPFCPVTVDPSWLTSTVLELVRQMYDSRDFSAMPILADALQDAGCDNDNILNHCRSDGPHVRGCYVVDLLLGKE